MFPETVPTFMGCALNGVAACLECDCSVCSLGSSATCRVTAYWESYFFVRRAQVAACWELFSGLCVLGKIFLTRKASPTTTPKLSFCFMHCLPLALRLKHFVRQCQPQLVWNFKTFCKNTYVLESTEGLAPSEKILLSSCFGLHLPVSIPGRGIVLFLHVLGD